MGLYKFEGRSKLIEEFLKSSVGEGLNQPQKRLLGKHSDPFDILWITATFA